MLSYKLINHPMSLLWTPKCWRVKATCTQIVWLVSQQITALKLTVKVMSAFSSFWTFSSVGNGATILRESEMFIWRPPIQWIKESEKMYIKFTCRNIEWYNHHTCTFKKSHMHFIVTNDASSVELVGITHRKEAHSLCLSL